MNAIRERVSIIQRAGGRSSRVGATYINGVAYNPRVLIALMKIWRVHYNFFDWRPYRLHLDAEAAPQEETETIAKDSDPESSENVEKFRRIAVPGTDKAILVPKRRTTKVVRTTPAMRMGVHQPWKPKDSEPEMDIAEEDAVEENEAPPKKRDRGRDDRPHLPDLSKILYQPWLFYRTPRWRKLQGR
jgi:hypothetical protein